MTRNKYKELEERLEEYKQAYYYLLELWDYFPEEVRGEIDRDLNSIFIINREERSD